MSSALCPEGQENWILSNKESQKKCRVQQESPSGLCPVSSRNLARGTIQPVWEASDSSPSILMWGYRRFSGKYLHPFLFTCLKTQGNLLQGYVSLLHIQDVFSRARQRWYLHHLNILTVKSTKYAFSHLLIAVSVNKENAFQDKRKNIEIN